MATRIPHITRCALDLLTDCAANGTPAGLEWLAALESSDHATMGRLMHEAAAAIVDGVRKRADDVAADVWSRCQAA